MSLSWGWLEAEQDASSLFRCVALSAGGQCQLDEPEQAAKALGRYVPRAAPQALAGAPEPRARHIDFQGHDGFDA